MSVRFHDPRGVSAAPVEAYEHSIDLSTEGLSVGLLANGFPGSVEFLSAVESVMSDHLPHATFHSWNKGNASSAVSEKMLGEIVAECQTVVAAYGH